MLRDILTASQNWASAAHYGKTHNGHPTFEHLTEVVTKIYEFDNDEEVIAAGWLHDTLKYTDTQSWEISKTLSRRAARIVELVTDPPGYNRLDIKAELYKNLWNESNAFIRADAGFLKSVDRFCNQRNAIATLNTEKIATYIAEFPDFIRFVANQMMHPTYRPGRHRLWTQLFQQYQEMVRTLDGDLR